MFIVTWSARRIALLWIAVVVLQGVALLPYAFERVALLRQSDESSELTSTPMDSTSRALLLAALRNSLGVELAMRGDTIVDARLNARGDSVVRPVLRVLERSVDAAVEDLWLPMLLGVVLMLSPTIVGIVLTVTWWVSRRRRDRLLVPRDA